MNTSLFVPLLLSHFLMNVYKNFYRKWILFNKAMFVIEIDCCTSHFLNVSSKLIVILLYQGIVERTESVQQITSVHFRASLE